METKKRSLVKSVSYRIFSFSSDLLVVFLVTSRLDFAVSVVVMTNIASTLIYFFHERVWGNFSWGRVRKLELEA